MSEIRIGERDPEVEYLAGYAAGLKAGRASERAKVCRRMKQIASEIADGDDAECAHLSNYITTIASHIERGDHDQ